MKTNLMTNKIMNRKEQDMKLDLQITRCDLISLILKAMIVLSSTITLSKVELISSSIIASKMKMATEKNSR